MLRYIYLGLLLFLLQQPGTADELPGTLEKLKLSNVEFAVNLYKEILKDPKVTNIIFSPLSIAAALTMTKLGSKGDSSEQIAKALLLEEIEPHLLNSAFGELNTILFEKPGENITLKAANGAFVSKNALVVKDFKNALSVFGSDIEELDFEDTTGSTEFINQWISENTGGLIPNMIADTVPAETVLLLASTLYFNGDWHSAFMPMQTENRAFYTSHRRVIDTPFMYQRGKFKFGYVEPLTLQILEMPYVNQEISMIVMLPDNFDLNNVEKHLNYKNLTEWLSRMEYETVDITFPKFNIEESVELQNTLQGLGIKDIFQRGIADLSGISGDRSLFVDKILHKGVLEITHQGGSVDAERADAYRTPDTERKVFYADHPFIFLIQKSSPSSRELYLMGACKQPTGKERGHDEL